MIRAASGAALASCPCARDAPEPGYSLFLWGDPEGVTYSDLAGQLDMTEGAIKMAATRLRRRCREILRAEVAQTVTGPEEIEDEVRHLISVLRG